MLGELMEHDGITRSFRDAGYYETTWAIPGWRRSTSSFRARGSRHDIPRHRGHGRIRGANVRLPHPTAQGTMSHVQL